MKNRKQVLAASYCAVAGLMLLCCVDLSPSKRRWERSVDKSDTEVVTNMRSGTLKVAIRTAAQNGLCRSVRLGEGRFRRDFLFRLDGTLESSENFVGIRLVTDLPRGDAPRLSETVYGRRATFHTNGAIRGELCQSPPAPGSSAEKLSILCGSLREYTSDGKLKESAEYAQCTMGCGEFLPILPKDEYRVSASALRVRAKPNQHSKLLFSLPKDSIVHVLQDMGNIETIDHERAPWGKVKTKDGRTGFAFGGFLRMTKGLPKFAEELCKKGPPE